MANGGQIHGEGGVELDPEAGLVAVLDEDAETRPVLGEDLAEAVAAVRSWRLCLALDEGEAGGEADERVLALRLVVGEVRAAEAGAAE